MRNPLLAALSLVLGAAQAVGGHPMPPPHVPPSVMLVRPDGVVVDVVPMVVGPVLLGVPTGFYRPSPSEHWQYRSFNYFGQVRPRVDYYRGQAWYAADGAPYFAPHSVPGVFRP